MPVIPPSANTRVVVAQEPTPAASATAPAADAHLAAADFSVRLQRPHTGQTIKRRILNAITFGYYTKHQYNPAQWAAFRAALLVRYQDLGEQKVDEALRSYEHTRRLSQSKASAVLDKLSSLSHSVAQAPAVAHTNGLQPLGPGARPLNASQATRLRAQRTRLEAARTLTANETQLRQRLRDIRENFTAVAAVPSDARSADEGQEVDDFGLLERDTGPSPEEIARQHFADKLNSVDTILQPGRSIGFNAIALGQEAIQAKATAAGIHFGHHSMASREQSVREHLQEVKNKVAEFSQEPRAQEGRSLFAVPLSLRDDSRFFREDHSVLVMIDFNRKKLLYLDAKGMSPRNAERKYGNTEGLQAELEQLGQSAFGADWKAADGLLMLSNAKQQGANDCGAFTHDFTRRLVVDGVALADIERDFDVGNRGEMRMRMLENILDEGLLDPPASPQA